MFLILFQSISAIAGGLGLIADPSGGLSFTLGMLQHSPFSDFLIPGLFLLIILGIVPGIVFYGLWKKPRFRLAEKVNPKYHWSWTFSLCTGILILVWVGTEIFLIRELSILHYVYSVLGVLIIVFTLLSKKDYRI